MTSREINRRIISRDLWIETLDWRNDPDVYVFNRTDRPIGLQEHLSWFMNRQTRMQKEPVFSYHDDEDFIGIARLDELSDTNYEVSLIVNPVFQGKGHGKQILDDICQYFSTNYSKKSKLTAVIHNQNLRSQKLFHALQFQFLSEDTNFKTYVYAGN